MKNLADFDMEMFEQMCGNAPGDVVNGGKFHPQTVDEIYQDWLSFF